MERTRNRPYADSLLSEVQAWGTVRIKIGKPTLITREQYEQILQISRAEARAFQKLSKHISPDRLAALQEKMEFFGDVRDISPLLTSIVSWPKTCIFLEDVMRRKMGARTEKLLEHTSVQNQFIHRTHPETSHENEIRATLAGIESIHRFTKPISFQTYCERQRTFYTAFKVEMELIECEEVERRFHLISIDTHLSMLDGLTFQAYLENTVSALAVFRPYWLYAFYYSLGIPEQLLEEYKTQYVATDKAQHSTAPLSLSHQAMVDLYALISTRQQYYEDLFKDLPEDLILETVQKNAAVVDANQDPVEILVARNFPPHVYATKVFFHAEKGTLFYEDFYTNTKWRDISNVVNMAISNAGFEPPQAPASFEDIKDYGLKCSKKMREAFMSKYGNDPTQKLYLELIDNTIQKLETTTPAKILAQIAQKLEATGQRHIDDLLLSVGLHPSQTQNQPSTSNPASTLHPLIKKIRNYILPPK